MQKKFLILSVILSFQQIVIYASLFVPKSSFFNTVTENLLAKEPVPAYIEKHLKQSKNVDSQEALNEFQQVKMRSILNVSKLIDSIENSVYKNGELNCLFQSLKQKQTPANIQILLKKQYVSALSNLGVLNPEEITTESLRKEFSHYLVPKKDIAPEYSIFIQPHIRQCFETIIKNFPEENITNISSITPFETDSIRMPAASVAKPAFNAYEQRLSHKRSNADILFALTHELGHALALDSHRVGKAGQQSFGGSIIKRMLNINKIDSSMAQVYRSCEFIADTNIITQLAFINPQLAIELCEHGINSCANHIALDHMKYFTTGEAGPTVTLTSHNVKDHHPTWPARLLVLLRIYESLKS